VERCLPPKGPWGLGIHNLKAKNTALLGKWLFKFLIEDGIWQNILKLKYFGTKSVSLVMWKPDDSHFWSGLMATKKHFFRLGSF
jgi:hypothetical protein